jgi:hypothetical protein
VTTDRKDRLLERYIRNLEATAAHPAMKSGASVGSAFACPLCMKLFERSQIDKDPQIVTLEHIPPLALGGSPRTITCRDCNSRSGHELDTYLLNSLELREFLQHTPGASVDASVEFGSKTKVNATLRFTGQSEIAIETHPHRTDPAELQKLKSLRGTAPPAMKFRFKGKHGRGVRLHRPPVALIRIGYLWAFSVFGYGFLANPYLREIQRQIDEPDTPGPAIVAVSEIDANIEGIVGLSVVIAPAPLQSFMIAFDLVTSLTRYRYAVLLPGPSSPGDGIYANLSSATLPLQPNDLSIIPVPEDDALIDDPKLAIASQYIWSEWRNQG